MALGDIQLRFAWQAWHLVTAGVALGDIYLRFAWQSWHLRHSAGSGGALGRTWLLGVALGDIHLRSA